MKGSQKSLGTKAAKKDLKKKGMSVQLRDTLDSVVVEPIHQMLTVKQSEKPRIDNDLWQYSSAHRQEPFEISVEIKTSKKDKTL